MADYKDISITWAGDISSTSGFAQYGRSILKPLVQGGASVQLEMLPAARPEQKLDPWWEEHFQVLKKNVPGILRINHGSPFNKKKNITGGPTVCLTHWETTKVPVDWIKYLNQFDEVWTTSPVLLDEQSTNAITVPARFVRQGIDVDEINRNKEILSIEGVNKQAFVFGTVGQWNQRRNMSDILLAYLTEFSDKENVSFVVKTFGQQYYNPNERRNITGLVRELKRTLNRPGMPKIVLIHDMMDYRSFASLVRRFSVMCSSCRGESKNISTLIAAAMGKQCVYIDSTANMDLTQNLGDLMYPVKYALEPVTSMGSVYSGNDTWARPDVIHLREQMRHAYLDYMTEDLRDRRKALKGKVRAVYSPQASAHQFAKNYRLAVGEQQVVTL